MNYETALKLKAAGFPQNFTGECDSGCNVANEDLTDYVYSPTLSELIEACGDDLVRLENTDHGWVALENVVGKYYEPGENHEFEYDGSTPTEAVANLYLALHTK